MGDTREPRLGKTLRFMQKLWALVHELDAKSKRMHRDLGVTGPQRLALRIVGRDPGIVAGDLAALLRVHPSTLTGVLSRLEDQALIERTIDPEDRRRMHIELTRRGRRVDDQLTGTVEAALRRALARCDPEEVDAASRLIDTIVEELAEDAPA
jgi:DNA-binding MarR family transcriptional regulator